MVNQQLVEYVKQQVQAGVANDVVRKALNDAGWAPADVDDSMKAAQPAATAASPAAAVAQPTINPVVAMGGVDIATKPAASAQNFATTKNAATGAASDGFFSRSAAAGGKHSDDLNGHSSKKVVITMVIMGIIILLLAGGIAYVYFSMGGSTPNSAASTDAAQLATLQNEVSQLNGDKTTLTNQMTALNATTTELMNELSFFAVPPAPAVTASSTSSSTTPAAPTVITSSISGTISGTGATAPFVLTTMYNLKISVANYKDANVKAALTPFVNTTTTVTLTGTHAPGSASLTVADVNGTATP